MIFDEEKPEVIAVLDWELSTLGDPLSDLAYNCLPHHLPPNFPALKGKNRSFKQFCCNIKSHALFTLGDPLRPGSNNVFDLIQ